MFQDCANFNVILYRILVFGIIKQRPNDRQSAKIHPQKYKS